MHEVWKFQTRRFVVSLFVESIPCYQYDGEDPDGSTQRALDAGELVAFDSEVRVAVRGECPCSGCRSRAIVVGRDCLGGSVYRDGAISEFWTAHRDPDPAQRNTLALKAQRRVICHYFPDMVRCAIGDARDTFRKLPRLADHRPLQPPAAMGSQP